MHRKPDGRRVAHFVLGLKWKKNIYIRTVSECGSRNGRFCCSLLSYLTSSAFYIEGKDEVECAYMCVYVLE